MKLIFILGSLFLSSAFAYKTETPVLNGIEPIGSEGQTSDFIIEQAGQFCIREAPVSTTKPVMHLPISESPIRTLP